MAWSLAVQPFLKTFGQLKYGPHQLKTTLMMAKKHPPSNLTHCHRHPRDMPHPTRQVAIVTGAVANHSAVVL